MKNRDIILENFDADSWQNLKTFVVESDTDHMDIGNILVNVTITNNTTAIVYVKGCSGMPNKNFGRKLAIGESFNYLELDLSHTFIKTSDGTATGNIEITGYIE